MSCILLRGRWCNIIDWNVHATSEDESDDSKDTVYKELGQVFYNFPNQHMKIQLGVLNT
jgi:hypothetical protein